MKRTSNKSSDKSRRSFVKTAAYVTPAILTLKVTPAFAQLGSTRRGGGQGLGSQNSGGTNRNGGNSSGRGRSNNNSNNNTSNGRGRG